MNELTSLVSLAPAFSILAAALVTYVSAWKRFMDSFHQVTAIVLALGVTMLAVIGTAQIIFVPSPSGPFTTISAPSGSALMLLPFLTLAVGRLLSELLVAASGSAAEGRPQPGAMETEAAGKTGAPPAKESKNVASKTKPRGRPKILHPQEAQRENHEENVKGTKKPDQVAAVARGS